VSAGFFGKVPGHGDFVERGLPGSFKEVWDEWLQHGIAASKASIGEGWLDAYLTSPVWRFAVAPGLCGESGWVGVMVPSVDKVGRYFPLTIAASVDAGTVPLQMMVAAANWHDAAQDVALAALQDEQTEADVLAQHIVACSETIVGQPPIYCETPQRDPREALHAHALCLPFSYGSTPGHGLLAFSHRMVEALFGSLHSIWWTHGSEHVHPGMFACAQLPTSEAFAGMLTDLQAAPGWVRLQGYAVGESAAVAPVQEAPVATEDFVEVALAPPVSDPAESAVSAEVEAAVQELAAGDQPVEGSEQVETADAVNPIPVSGDDILAGFDAPDEDQTEEITLRKEGSDDGSDQDPDEDLGVEGDSRS